MDLGWDLPLLNVAVDLTFAIRMHGDNSIIVRHYKFTMDGQTQAAFPFAAARGFSSPMVGCTA